MSVDIRNGRSWLVAASVGSLAAVISIARLWLFDRSSPGEVLWAEDGLFTLCIHKADFWTCLSEPFAGYLHFLPRLMVWPVSLLPWEHWALAANLTAAVLAGFTSGIAFTILYRNGLHQFVAIAVALLPVISPMVGLEAINVIACSYMLLLFLSTLLIAFPPPTLEESESKYAFGGVILLLVTALTIPSAVVLVPLVLIMAIRGHWSRRIAGLWLGGLGLGLVIQFVVVRTAEVPRELNLSGQAIQAWVDAIPVSLLTFWPGLSIGQYSFFTNFQMTPLGITGWMIAVAMLLGGAWLILRGSPRRLPIGLLLLAGLGFGLIPSVIGYANNRYFVVPLLLWGAALIVALDGPIRRTNPWIVGLITVIVLVIWWPAMAASAYRATPAPPWSDEVARVEARCASEPGFVERPIFTPFWPPNWGDGLTEPTHPDLPCPIVYRWLPS